MTTKRRPGFNKTRRMSDGAVRAKTGKTWAQWFRILDHAGANKMNHTEIVALLNKRYHLGMWWQQMVTVEYEQDRGLRKKHQKPTGFQISRSITLSVPAARAFGAWTDDVMRKLWLKDPELHIRKATSNKSLRATWIDDQTSVEISFYPKNKARVQVVVQHSKLKTAAAAEKMKLYWGKNLAKLGELLLNR